MEPNNALSMERRIMVVDDDQYLLAAIHQTLTMHHFMVASFDKPADALAELGLTQYLAIIADVKMPGIHGLALLERVRAVDQDLPVIMITGHGDVEMAVRAMKSGAYDFLEKPVDEDVLLASLSRAVEKMALILNNRELHERLALAREQRTGFQSLVGQHPLMQRLYDTIEIVAREEDPVLISGETGTGKELVARAIHSLSARRDAPFVAVNMGAIPADMLEAELFGYEKGAFTGATQTKEGKFEFAKNGTLFLDEICSLPVTLQAKLLRVLEDRAYQRLGANRTIPVQARIMAASNSDLGKEIEAGRFRQDLFFRLNVLPIETPALRDHKSDIPLLVKHFCEISSVDHDRSEGLLGGAMLKTLYRNEWRGNVRELKNFLRRFCLYGDNAMEMEARTQTRHACMPTGDGGPLREAMDVAEKEHLLRVLQFYNGQIAGSCKALRVSRKCLYDKINKHQLDLTSLRSGSGTRDE